MAATLLIVEDDTFLINAYRFAFEKEGYTLIIAHDGEEALKELQSHQVDAVILDMIMPKKSGGDFLKALRSTEGKKDIPVVVATNMSNESEKALCLEYGVSDYCVKSDVSIDTIAQRVKSILEK